MSTEINNAENEENISIERNYNLMFLAGMIAEKHVELESQKILKKLISLYL